MTYRQVYAYYGSQDKIARKLGISQPAVSHWSRRGVPLLRQYQLERITGGELRVNTRVKR